MGVINRHSATSHVSTRLLYTPTSFINQGFHTKFSCFTSELRLSFPKFSKVWCFYVSFFFVLCVYCNVELLYYCITQLCFAIRPFGHMSVNKPIVIVKVGWLGLKALSAQIGYSLWSYYCMALYNFYYYYSIHLFIQDCLMKMRQMHIR